jgi:hypothetical protein
VNHFLVKPQTTTKTSNWIEEELKPSMAKAPRKPRKIDPLKQPSGASNHYEKYDPKVHK